MLCVTRNSVLIPPSSHRIALIPTSLNPNCIAAAAISPGPSTSVNSGVSQLFAFSFRVIRISNLPTLRQSPGYRCCRGCFLLNLASGERAVQGRAPLCPWFKGGRVVERRLSWWGQHLGWDSMLALLLEHPLEWETCVN